MARLVVVQQKSHTALDVCGDRGFVGKLAGSQQGTELEIGLDHPEKLPGGMGAGLLIVVRDRAGTAGKAATAPATCVARLRKRFARVGQRPTLPLSAADTTPG